LRRGGRLEAVLVVRSHGPSCAYVACAA
jgi:hypothetical protein